MKKIAVVGGGLAGLAAAFELRKAGAAAVLVEPGRLGGKIVTDRPEGFVIEGGPDSFISYKPAAAELARELGLGDELIPASPLPTLLYSRGRLEPLPEGASLAPTKAASFLASPLLSWPGKLRVGLELVLPRGGEPDESLAAFVRRRLGGEFYERWAEPLLSGVYGGDPAELSLACTFPRLAELERKHGSVIRGLSKASGRAPGPLFWTLKRGLASLVEALEKKLSETDVLREKAEGAEPGKVRLAGGRVLEADAVILACPAWASAELLSGELAGLLKEIAYGDAATVSLAFWDPRFPKASGFLVPKAEGRAILGATFSSNKYAGRAPAGAGLARVYFGGRGAWRERSDERLKEAALEELSELAGVSGKPSIVRVFRWPRSMPQYRVGHPALLERIGAALPKGIILAGSSYRGVGLSDCVESGKRAAQAALEGRSALA